MFISVQYMIPTNYARAVNLAIPRTGPLGAFCGPRLSSRFGNGSERGEVFSAIVCPPSVCAGEIAMTVTDELTPVVAPMKAYPMLEVARHTSRSDCWMVVDGKVYDVTSFLDEHPGGEDILIDSAGRDATREFEDVGHSGEARSQLSGLYIGELREPTAQEIEEVAESEKLRIAAGGSREDSLAIQAAKWLLPILLAGFAYLIRKYAK